MDRALQRSSRHLPGVGHASGSAVVMSSPIAWPEGGAVTPEWAQRLASSLQANTPGRDPPAPPQPPHPPRGTPWGAPGSPQGAQGPLPLHRAARGIQNLGLIAQNDHFFSPGEFKKTYFSETSLRVANTHCGLLCVASTQCGLF